eukprot:scaffold2773_cov119-Skeletonema_dohrnii-CCMP3373.AAC.3
MYYYGYDYGYGSGPRMVGDLPLKEYSHFRSKLVGDSSDTRYCADSEQLFQIQFTLHYQSLNRNEVSIASTNTKTPYHEDVLPNWDAFVKRQENNDSLTSFTISNVELPPMPFFSDKLVPILKNSANHLVSLELSRNVLKNIGIASVAALLKSLRNLVSLVLKENQLTNEAGIKLLSKAMKKHPSLSHVDLSYCSLGESTSALSLILKGSEKLSSLVLDYNDFESDGMELIIKFLKSNTTLTALSLRHNTETKEGGKTLTQNFLKPIAQTLERSSLRELSLRGSDLTLATKVESKVLCDMLMHIDLSYNRIGVQGLKNVVTYLQGNPPLTGLNLAGNSFRKEAGASLMGVLKRNTNLAHLNLRHNSFSKASIPFIIDALKNNSTLLTLDLTDNKLKAKSGGRKEIIDKALFESTSLQSIIDSNHTCQVYLSSNSWGNRETHEAELRRINALDTAGQSIRFKVSLAMFTLKTIQFNPLAFQHISLELMPRLLEFVQQQVGYGGYGKNIWKVNRKERGKNHVLSRIYEVMTGWSMLPSLFERGPGKIKKKAVKKRKHAFAFKEADDEEWTPSKAN